jgi:hypothetical protein
VLQKRSAHVAQARGRPPKKTQSEEESAAAEEDDFLKGVKKTQAEEDVIFKPADSLPFQNGVDRAGLCLVGAAYFVFRG